jgi:four helix bundle protein
MGDFKRTRAWKLARALTNDIYELVEQLPRWEEFSLKSQLTSSSNSIKANLAEGLGRGYPKDLRRFCKMAMGSATEVESHLTTAIDANHINEKEFDRLTADVRQVQMAIVALIKKSNDQPPNL